MRTPEGRRAGIELDPLYCDVIVQRMAKVAGLEAVHVESGRAFADLAEARAIVPEAV